MPSPHQHHNQSTSNRGVTRSSRSTAGIVRPLCEQSKFGFGADGCVYRPREAFQAMMRGRLSRPEIYAIGLHKMKCWKCKETFAALLQEFEDNMVQQVAESDPQLAEMLDEADEDPDFGGQEHDRVVDVTSGCRGRGVYAHEVRHQGGVKKTEQNCRCTRARGHARGLCG